MDSKKRHKKAANKAAAAQAAIQAAGGTTIPLQQHMGQSASTTPQSSHTGRMAHSSAPASRGAATWVDALVAGK
jgi:hypothetical protein